MTDEGYRFFLEMLEQSGQVGEKIFVLIAAARARPFAVAMTAQIDGHGVLDRHTALEQRVEKMIPASPLITHAMDEDISFLVRITPLPVMNAQTIVQEITPSGLRLERGLGRF